MALDELRQSLPGEVIESAKSRGIGSLTPPQETAIKKGLLTGLNVVVAAPTASGKTFIAEMAMARTVLWERKKALYVAPMRALVSEKFSEIKQAYPYLKVAMSIGELDSLDLWLDKYDIIFVSTEKLDSLIRHGISWLDSVGCIVIDELHMLGELGRGPTLEVLITRLRRLCKDAQIIGLSATVGNAEELAKWLDAQLVRSEYRPVPLEKGIILNENVNFGDREELMKGSSAIPEIRIMQDTLEKKKQILLFYSTKRNTEAGAEKLAEAVRPFLSIEEKIALDEASTEILSALGRPTSQCEKLAKLVKSGVAFHHSGLVNAQRAAVEQYFKNGVIKAVCATTTLCLPPEEEIITNPERRPIRLLNSEDKVLTHKGDFKRVILPLKSNYKGNLIRITPYGQFAMNMTEEHRILVVRRKRHSSHWADGRSIFWWEYSKPSWIEAKEVQKGDMVLFPRIKKSQRLGSIKLDRIGPLSNQSGVVGSHWTRINTDMVKLDQDTMEIIGLFVAEGYTGKNGIIRFAINTKEEFLTSKITKWFDSLSLNYTVKDFERHRRIINACSKQLSFKFRQLFGSNAREKRLPQGFLFLARNQLISLVRGMWLGDGTIYLKKNYGEAEYRTTSRILADQLFMILVKLGFMPRMSYSKTVETQFNPSYKVQIPRHGDIYGVSIAGKQLKRFAKEILLRNLEFSGNRTYNLGKIDKDYYYMPVRKIEKKEYDGVVYNLEVEEDASYVGSFIVHNSLGVNLPAHTVVVRDTTRYSEGEGSVRIGINEVTQLFGRAGRPKYDKYGRALLIAKSKEEAKDLFNRYILSDLESIYSKLGVMPVLRTHVLSFVATDFLTMEESISAFLYESFYGSQRQERHELRRITRDILDELEEWKFIEAHGSKYKATRIGRRVSELYIDPVSAKWIIDTLPRVVDEISCLFMITNTVEMKPYSKATEEAEELFVKYGRMLEGQAAYENYFYDPIKPFSTALMLNEWIDEAGEQALLTKYRETPGSVFTKTNNADWLLYSSTELARLVKVNPVKLLELRVRMRYGIKKELLDLVRLEQVGRVRARLMYNAGIKKVEDLRTDAAKQKVERMFGKEIAGKILSQVDSGNLPK